MRFKCHGPVAYRKLVVLEEGRRWQENIRKARGVCEDLFIHHGEEIFAHQSSPNARLIGYGGLRDWQL